MKRRSWRDGLDRRSVLRGGLFAVGLPWLEVFLPRRAYACDNGLPRRFGLFFWGNGNRPDQWVPVGEGAEWELSEELAPLMNVKPYLCVVSGMSVKVPNIYPHGSGMGGILTAAPLTDDEDFAGPTIDQVIAAEIGGDTVYRSLLTAATNCSGSSANGPGSRNYAETDPYGFYLRVFGDSFRAPGEEGLVDPTLALRQSALDAVLEDASTLRGRLGTADQARLDQHLEGIYELESRLAKLQADPPDLAACTRPGAPAESYPDEDGRPQYSARSRAMCDLLTMALACDQTRVFGHYINDPINDTLFPDAWEGHHQLTHDEASPQPTVHAITTMITTEFAYLLERLAAVPEADGTLLDNCLVMGMSEVSEGRTHSLDDMPIVIAGGGCGRIRTGWHHRSYSQDNATKVLLSVIRAMDVDLASYGTDEAWTDETLTEIET